MTGPADKIALQLAASGLIPMGRFVIAADETAARPELAGRQAMLFGNAGGAMWQAFRRAPEFADGLPNPMNRWTERIVGEALDDPEEALFPFGEAIWPFQRWAKRALGIEASPLGLLIHPEWGLWFALRCAVVLPETEASIQAVEKRIHPCDTCHEKPCLSACPVSAFSLSGYDVAACRSWIGSTPSRGDSGGRDCLRSGCGARDACPVGRGWRYGGDQIRFHMAAFTR